MLVMGFILVWGVVLAAHGTPWLLLVGVVLFLLAFARIGCLGH
jgi:hypothetical protein